MKNKMNTEIFIKKAKEKHGEKYDYSKSEYTNANTKICIICPEHGEFEQHPYNHLKGCECIDCGNKKTQDKLNMKLNDFIEKAKKAHGNKYDYSKVEYVNSQTKVCIICLEHGEFCQRANNHLLGIGCSKCGDISRSEKKMYSLNEFIDKSNIKHNHKYDYSKVNYVGVFEKVCIICPEHGEFLQTPGSHMSANGCPKCAHQYVLGKYRLGDIDHFIKRCDIIHNHKYDYSKSIYINNSTKTTITCPEHGEFLMTPAQHLEGHGCQKCSKNYRPTTEEFIERAKEIHGDKYDYSKVEYINAKTKVCIICLEHGEFWQRPDGHLRGSGCDLCDQSHLERVVKQLLEENNIKFDYNYRDFDWLRNKNKLELDFYLPDTNIAIECQGIQHFKAMDFFGGVPALKQTQKNDEIKKRLCEENGISLLYINYNDKINDRLDEILKIINPLV